jgi:hypothetical protein
MNQSEICEVEKLTEKKNQALDEKPLIKGEMEELETRWKNIYYFDSGIQQIWIQTGTNEQVK